MTKFPDRRSDTIAIEKTSERTYAPGNQESSAGHCSRHSLNDPSRHTGERAGRIGLLGDGLSGGGADDRRIEVRAAAYQYGRRIPDGQDAWLVAGSKNAQKPTPPGFTTWRAR